MGKSVARFFVTGWTPERVLGLAQSVGAAHGLAPEMASSNSILMAAGAELWTGRQVLSVVAFGTQGGVNVDVGAWIEAGVQANVKPRRFLKNSPANRLWRAAADLVTRLGGNADSVFVHT